jgi:hypothetical protein
MRLSLLTLFCLNLALVLFPVIAPEWDAAGTNALFADQLALYGKILSSVLTPLLVAATIGFTLLDARKKPITRALLFSSLAVCVLMALSATFADTVRIETLFMGLFFVLFNLYLALMKANPRGADDVVRIFKAFFAIWLLAPIVAMLVDPSLVGTFFVVTQIDVSYHGFADSRVGFGLWISVFIILLRRPNSKFEWFLMLVSVVTLLLSQSRAAIFGLLLSYSYAMFRARNVRQAVVLRLIALLALCLAPLLLWSILGRDDALTLLSEDRGVILSRFSDFIETHWLLGNGGMYLVDIPEIDRIDVPAHNFLLQTVANYGVLTLAAFLAYFVCIFRFVRSTRARMLLIFLFVYSMNQPVQGTGNFFNPITLLFFLVAFAVDNIENRATRSALHPATARAKGIGSWGPGQKPTSA